MGYTLLELVAVSGELPADQLCRLPGGDSYKLNVVRALKSQKLLRTYYRDGVRGYRLTAPAKKALCRDNPERFSFSLSGSAETNLVKSEITRRLRLHRVAEATLTMKNAGVLIFRDEKPDVFSPEWEETDSLSITVPAFYTSREIKEMGTVFAKIRGARSVGVLLTPADVFVVYDLGNSLMKWEYKSEMRTKALMKTVLCRERLPHQYPPEAVQGLLLADSMEQACDILKENEGRQYFILDGNYEHFYFLTNDRKGERLLSLLCSRALTERLTDILYADLYECDFAGKDRNFIYSKKGTYGTSGFMSEKEAEEIFDLRTSLKNHNGTIFGLLNGRYVCMPEESMLNKNVAVYGASGSMKTRAYCINRILQATVPGKDGKMESLIICDPKSELYEKTSELLRKTHTVKVFNLVCPENSDSWNCLAEIEGDELMAQRFCDVIIKNTGSERGDHFWDSAEMNLLKALVLYVEQGYPPERKNIGQVYRLLTHCDEKELNSLFNMLPSSHPAKAPYAIFQQASDTVRSGVIIGLGSRLQVFQNRSICNMTAFDEIDMELPGQQPCAYFCITSDQDSTFDFLSSLFLSFVFIKLVRYADKNCEGGKLPIPVHVLGEELTACGVIPDLSRKISVIRSRNISMSCVFQNLAGLQNRYPLNQWQEILGNSDVQLFLGCVDELTAKYISDRSGEVSVHVQSKAKQLGTWRISNYTPEYRETSGVGKRKLLTMDEVLRLPISKALIIIRGRKLLQVDKCDYTKHLESKKMISCKASAHIPEWQKKQPKEVEEVSPAPVKKPGRKKRAPTSNVVPTDKDSIMSKN